MITKVKISVEFALKDYPAHSGQDEDHLQGVQKLIAFQEWSYISVRQNI